MFLTNVLLSKVKSKYVMVLLRSTGSDHIVISFRERVEPKKEILFYDPMIEQTCVYKEEKKIRSMKWPLKITKTVNEDSWGKIDS